MAGTWFRLILRERVVRAVDGGMAAQAAGRRFDIEVDTVARWSGLRFDWTARYDLKGSSTCSGIGSCPGRLARPDWALTPVAEKIHKICYATPGCSRHLEMSHIGKLEMSHTPSLFDGSNAVVVGVGNA